MRCSIWKLTSDVGGRLSLELYEHKTVKIKVCFTWRLNELSLLMNLKMQAKVFTRKI